MSKLRGGICDARCQQFHRECVKKEEDLKRLWFIKNQQRLYDNLSKQTSVQKSQKGLLQKKKLLNSIIPAEDARKVKPPILPSWRPSTKDVEFDLMRPINPAIKNILYVPKDETFAAKGRYLHERYKEKPEDRYYFPYCSSWMIGWRLKDYPQSSVSIFGVRSVIQSSFYRRNASSLQRDPDWYRMCQTGDPKNFNEILTY